MTHAGEVAAQEDLPLLTFDVVRDICEFPEFAMTVTAEEVAEYRSVTGTADQGETVPPGYAAVFGRLGYLRRHRMPGGGVLLGQEIRWMHPAALGEPLEIKTVVESAVEDARCRRKAVFVTTARQHGEHVATVRIVAGWPV